jgi:hypothetical protein
MRRLLCSVLVVAALAFGASPAVAEEPASTQGLAALIDAFPDGGRCTGVPDALPGIFDFSSACAFHDVCYASGQSQLACDEAFRRNMVAACAVQYPSAVDPRRYLCLTFAQLYFFGVRLFGQFFR